MDTAIIMDYGFKFAILVGLLVISQAVFQVLTVIYKRFLRGAKNLKKSYGSWAIVTGASDGIGLAMAYEFARKGLNVILISRLEESLKDCAEKIKAKYPSIEVRYIAIDYFKFDKVSQKKVSDFIAGLEIGILVNNVGISYDFTKYFHELDDDRVDSLISLNVESTTYMTRIVLPTMLRQKKGAIINISSAAGVTCSPLLAQYGGAKSYITMFSKALHEEYKDHNIFVACHVPLFVATKLAKIRKTSLFVPSPENYAKSAVAVIGYDAVISPYWSHSLQLWLLACLPEWLGTSITKNMHMGIRKAGMKKEASLKAGGAGEGKKAK